MNLARIIGMLFKGKDTLDDLIAAGDAKAAEFPELADEWARDRDKLVALRDDPALQGVLTEKLAEVVATFTAGHGPVGDSQAHHG